MVTVEEVVVHVVLVCMCVLLIGFCARAIKYLWGGE